MTGHRLCIGNLKRVWVSVSVKPGDGAVVAVTKWRKAMTKYVFKIGQVVQASGTSPWLPRGHLRVLRYLMPTPSGVPRYCVKSETETTERVAEQDQIEPVAR
jgi:hypothetical protein